MPALNVLTWNSTGETATGAAELHEIIRVLTVDENRPPDVIVIQEANANPGGPIYQMLAGLPGYNQPPSHAREGGTYGRGYLLLTRQGVGGQASLQRYDLATDGGVVQLLNSLNWQSRQAAAQELAVMHMPAVAVLSAGGGLLKLLTWHAPLGIGALLPYGTGVANSDAYLFLQNSELYFHLLHAGSGNQGIIAGDLNLTSAQLASYTHCPDMPEYLPGWSGMSDGLDHIVTYPQLGEPVPQYTNAMSFGTSSVHAILTSTVTW